MQLLLNVKILHTRPGTKSGVSRGGHLIGCVSVTKVSLNFTDNAQWACGIINIYFNYIFLVIITTLDLRNVSLQLFYLSFTLLVFLKLADTN